MPKNSNVSMAYSELLGLTKKDPKSYNSATTRYRPLVITFQLSAKMKNFTKIFFFWKIHKFNLTFYHFLKKSSHHLLLYKLKHVTDWHLDPLCNTTLDMRKKKHLLYSWHWLNKCISINFANKAKSGP